MKKPAPPNSLHPDELLLPYIEGRLDSDQKAMIEEHLSTCDECRTVKEQLAETVDLLKTNREVFCPEPWQVYELVHYGRDPDGTVVRHLEQCSECNEVAGSVAEKLPAEQIPPAVLQALKMRVADAARPADRRDQPREGLVAKLYRLYRFPVLAAGLAAAILALVVFLPAPTFQTGLVLSSDTWENVPTPKAFNPGMKRAAMVVLVKDSGQEPSQKKIDSLYEALAPTMELYERFRILSPAQLRDAIGKRRYRNDSVTEIVDRLHQELHVSTVVLITIRQKKKRATVDLELVDAGSGAVQAKKVEKDVPDNVLEGTIREAAHSLLLGAAPTPTK